VAAASGAVVAALVLAARALDRLPARTALVAAWALLPLQLTVLAWLARSEPAGTRMLVLVAGTFVAMKAVVLQAHRADGGRPLALGPWLWFTLPWSGMNPRLFAAARRGANARAGAVELARRGLRNTIAGVVLVGLAVWSGTAWAAPVLMVGLSLVVHFGLFTLLAALLRARGLPVRVLFDAPHRSHSLREFWAQRWNRGFSEMTALAVHRPLASRLGRRRAVWMSFLASGLLHEIAISLPVGAGFGLPTCYFVLQGLLVARERAAPGQLATLLWVVVPLPLVFHPWFVRGTILPLLG